MTVTRASIGATLRRARLAAGVSQDAVARHLGIGDTGVSSIEAGRAGSPIDRLAAFAAFCDAELGVYVVTEAQAQGWRRLAALPDLLDPAGLLDVARIADAAARLDPQERRRLAEVLELPRAGVTESSASDTAANRSTASPSSLRTRRSSL